MLRGANREVFRTGSALPAAEVLRTLLPSHGVERTGFGRADADCQRESLSGVTPLLEQTLNRSVPLETQHDQAVSQ